MSFEASLQWAGEATDFRRTVEFRLDHNFATNMPSLCGYAGWHAKVPWAYIVCSNTVPMRMGPSFGCEHQTVFGPQITEADSAFDARSYCEELFPLSDEISSTVAETGNPTVVGENGDDGYL